MTGAANINTQVTGAAIELTTVFEVTAKNGDHLQLLCLASLTVKEEELDAAHQIADSLKEIFTPLVELTKSRCALAYAEYFSEDEISEHLSTGTMPEYPSDEFIEFLDNRLPGNEQIEVNTETDFETLIVPRAITTTDEFFEQLQVTYIRKIDPS